MSPLRIVLRQKARRDIEDALRHYENENAPLAAEGLVDTLQRSLGHLARSPSSGSPRYAHILDVPDLGSWPMPRYPYLVFYVAHKNRIDIWRVLHGKRDIPAWMQDPESR